jgi:TolA-binding protein
MIPGRIAKNGSAFDRTLVRAARAERPIDGAEDRVLAALGLSSSVVSGQTATSGLRSSGVRLSRLVTFKGLLFATALVFGGGAIALAVRPRSPVPPAPPATIRATASSSPIPSTEEASAGEPVPTATLASATSSPSARVEIPSRKVNPSNIAVRAPRSVSPVRGTQSPSAVDNVEDKCATFSVEVALIQQATQALANQDATRAAAALDAYGNKCPSGVLKEEAAFLRVQVMLARGERREAKALARRLLQNDPAGVLAPRLEAILRDSVVP